MNLEIDNTKDKKLGFFISFKKTEKDLYQRIKSIDNYSNVIKTVMSEYLTNKEEYDVKNCSNDNRINLTIDDLCKIISSVNTHNGNYIQQANNIESDDISNIDIIPKDMLIGL